jgi:hypothetical protein
MALNKYVKDIGLKGAHTSQFGPEGRTNISKGIRLSRYTVRLLARVVVVFLATVFKPTVAHPALKAIQVVRKLSIIISPQQSYQNAKPPGYTFADQEILLIFTESRGPPRILIF